MESILKQELNKIVPFECEELRVRPLIHKDAVDYYKYISEDEIVNIFQNKNLKNFQLIDTYIKWIIKEKETKYAVVFKDNNKLIGGLSFYKKNKDDLWVGYWLGTPFWGKGYIVKVLKETLKHLRLTRIIKVLKAEIPINNKNSFKAAKKAGFELEKIKGDIYEMRYEFKI